MFCRFCGQPNPHESAKCVRCGAVLIGVSGGPTGAMGSAGPVKPYNYLVPAIIVTLFCCLPFGIASIIFSAQVDSRWNLGDAAGAASAAKTAKIFFWLSLTLGLVAHLMWLLIMASSVFADK